MTVAGVHTILYTCPHTCPHTGQEEEGTSGEEPCHLGQKYVVRFVCTAMCKELSVGTCAHELRIVLKLVNRHVLGIWNIHAAVDVDVHVDVRHKYRHHTRDRA